MINNMIKNLYKDIEILAKELKVDENKKILYNFNEVLQSLLKY